MDIGELLFIILLGGGMIGSGVLVGVKMKKWYLLGVFLTFFACFGLWEWLSVANTGESISQTVGAFGVQFPALFWIFIAMNVIAWGALMVHFIGMRKRR